MESNCEWEKGACKTGKDTNHRFQHSIFFALSRKCRRAVAAIENVLPHEKGGGQAAFDWRKRSKVREWSRPVCIVDGCEDSSVGERPLQE
jgi:hypothetical protein